jgi:hypothetical protein
MSSNEKSINFHFQSEVLIYIKILKHKIFFKYY